MKILLPSVAAALILLVIVWPDLTGQVSRFRITAAETPEAQTTEAQGSGLPATEDEAETAETETAEETSA